jgi:hypothetical protein
VQTCVGCGKNAPETDTNYTLISAQFGWRLTRVKRADGTVVLEWRCPTCWREYKKTRAPSAAGESTEMPVEPPSSNLRDTAVRTRPTVAPAPAPAHDPADPAPVGAPRKPGRSSR